MLDVNFQTAVKQKGTSQAGAKQGLTAFFKNLN
jgi:hypothetical protein